METNNWLALGSLVVSFTALLASAYSVYLAKMRDMRDVAGKRPIVDVLMPECEGRGPWAVNYFVKNKSDDPIIFNAIGIDNLADGGFKIEDRYAWSIERGRFKKNIYHRVVEVNEVIAPNAAYNGMLTIAPRDRRQLRDPVAVTFIAIITQRDEYETCHRLRIKRIASPDKINAST